MAPPRDTVPNGVAGGWMQATVAGHTGAPVVTVIPKGKAVRRRGRGTVVPIRIDCGPAHRPEAIPADGPRPRYAPCECEGGLRRERRSNPEASFMRNTPAFSAPTTIVLGCLAALVTGCGGGGGGESAAAPLAAPQDVGIVAGVQRVTVSWAPVPGATYYTVYLASAAGVSPGTYGLLPDGQHVPGVATGPITIEGIPDGKTIHGVVTASDVRGEGIESAEVSVAMRPAPPLDPWAVPGFTQVTVAWPAAPGAVGYRIYMASEPGVTSANWASLRDGAMLDVGGPSRVVVGGLVNGVTYYFVVAAINETGQSRDATPVAATPSGRGTFEFLGDFAVGYGPFALTSADFDGDGVLDLATADRMASTVSVLLGNGDGSFDLAATSPVGGGPLAVVAGDFDGDGVADLATANAYEDSVSVLLGLGDGTFVPGATAAAGGLPASLVAGDFDRDGDLDLAVADFDDAAVSILLGNGNGTFAAPVPHVVGAGPYSLVAGHFDPGTTLDLAVVDGLGGSVSLLLGYGNGDFASAVDCVTGPDPRALVAGDFDRDGALDLAVADGSGSVLPLHGNDDGTFSPGAVVPPSGADPACIAAGDLDGDGVFALVLPSAAEATLVVLRGDGTGGFSPLAVVPAVSDPRAMRLADFDGDGILDLAVADASAGTVAIYLGADG